MDKQPRRILVVDDNTLNLELARYVLATGGCLVETAADAAHVMPIIARFHPDLILMDIQMPGEDGLEMTRRLKANPDTRDIVIVAFTASAMRGDEPKARAAGCDGYITKPIDVTTFRDTVLSHINDKSPD